MERLNELYRNMIHVTIEGKEEYKKGGTRFGGVPDVPSNFIWPTFATAVEENDVVKEYPLSFLAQFNCAELAAFDNEGLLPHTGLLSFFYEMESQLWGYDPKDAGCAKVFWFEDMDNLVMAEVPQDLLEEYRFPQLKIRSKAEKSLPSWEDYSLIGSDLDEDWEQFDEKKKLLGVEEYDQCSKLLGWPDIIQNNMTCECELVSRGYYLGNTWSNIPTQEVAEVKSTSLDQWRLLFQLDTVYEDDFELMLGDCGRLYFYIRKEDLAARDFDRVWLILQCC